MAAGLAAGLAFAATAPALAQDAAGSSPSWDTLVRCAAMGSDDGRLACYDAAMRAAGYAPKPEVVAAEKRKSFGLSIPKLASRKHKQREEALAAVSATPPPAPEGDDRTVTVQLTRVTSLYDGNLLMITSDGAIWQQIDGEKVQPPPKAGDAITIRQSTFGGYFCDVNKWKAVRCVRSQ